MGGEKVVKSNCLWRFEFCLITLNCSKEQNSSDRLRKAQEFLILSYLNNISIYNYILCNK